MYRLIRGVEVMKRSRLLLIALAILILAVPGSSFAQGTTNDNELKRINIGMSTFGGLDIQLTLNTAYRPHVVSTWIGGGSWEQDHVSLDVSPFNSSTRSSVVLNPVVEMTWSLEPQRRWKIELTQDLLEKFRSLGKLKDGELSLGIEDRLYGIAINQN